MSMDDSWGVSNAKVEPSPVNANTSVVASCDVTEKSKWGDYSGDTWQQCASLQWGTTPPIDYLTFTANTDGSSISLYNLSGRTPPNIEVSINGSDWSVWDCSAITLASVGDNVRMRGNNPTGFNTAYYTSYFTMSGSISSSGNIMTLLDEIGATSSIPNWSCFSNLFQNCASLTSAPDLPATVLQPRCYNNMFQSCTSLTSAPDLPAPIILSYCYSTMFANCSSLTTPSIMSATTLAEYSCQYMFTNTAIKVRNSTATGATQFFTCPSTIPTGAVTGMFEGTAGIYVSNPVANGQYYYYQ